MPFLLAEILNFQGSTHHIGVGSFSKYGKEALVQKIEALKALQSGQKVRLRDGLTVDLRFSMGSSMAYGAVDYDKMYREADEKMYEDKRMRKKLAEETNTIES